jgi:hypothetical protein
VDELRGIIRDVKNQLKVEHKLLPMGTHLHYNSIDIYDDNTIHCPIPKYGCSHRDEMYKYGCNQERKDCAMNMMYSEDLD